MGTVDERELELYQPRPYQQEAVEFGLGPSKGRFILGDDMGLGKTGPALLLLKEWGKSPTLVVSGKNAQLAWISQPRYWGVMIPTIIQGQQWQRQNLWARVKSGELKFVVCTREVLKRDYKKGWVPRSWFCVIADEAHKDTNRKTQNYAALKWLMSQKMIMITGSPMKRGPQNLWALLNILWPRVFTSYWRFVEKYCHVIKNEYGGYEILGPKPGGDLAKDLQNVLLVRKKADVAKWLPPKTRIMDISLEMDDEQRKRYDQLSEDSIAELSEGKLLVTPSVLTKILRMRQILVCPKLLNPILPDGAAIDDLVERLDDAAETHMVVFTPFTGVFPYLSERLNEEGYTSVTHFRGGMQPHELGEAIEKFRRERGIAICSIQFAEGFDLTPASWAYFLGFEWDPNINWQAEDRLHRMNSLVPVTYYYPTYVGGVDKELVFDAVDDKARSIHKVINSVRELRARLIAARGTS